ncbi:Ribosomal protein S4e [Cinnamomum micranthum f. kanehirae]|uniref:Ribosomal protein S4e n=1 Tax=Cinnamomum micranthum f. kanehirae TaxID=337451 RepID=A0A3S4PTC2_9MAGN|nr:Ribosomal protein S4e [Cinnamomum micranthum f. kanehirae]
MTRFMAPMTTLCVWLVYMATWVTPFSAADKLTAYQVLQEYDFPVGILPKGALSYELDASTGKFSADLNGSCSFSLEGSYQLKYKSTIKGYISKDRLRDLSGVSVKVLFFWVNIIEVVRRGDQLQFSVGIASANFPISNFAECPQCGCGMDCLTLSLDEAHQVRSWRPFVSSN